MDIQPIKRGRGRPRKGGQPNAATLEKMGWKAADADTPAGDEDEGYDDGDEQPIDFQPTRIPNPLNLLKTGANVLSKVEAAAIRPFLIDAIRGYSDMADDTLSKTNRKRTVISAENDNLIWSNLEDAEVATLVDGLLIIGQRQKHVALAIREVARTWTMVQAGIILLPRFLATMRFYADNGGIALW